MSDRTEAEAGVIFQAAYYSSCSAALSDAGVADILDISRRNNGRDGITGMLLLVDGAFFQVVEGEQEAVERLLKRVEADPRHSGMLRVLGESRPDRCFADWSMGFEKVSAKDVAVFDAADLSGDARLKDLAARAPELVAFMRSLYRSRHMQGAPELDR